MYIRFFFASIFMAIFGLSYGQRQVTELDKTTHLESLKKGVLLVRLSEQTSKIKALNERGRSTEAESLKKETAQLNDLIVNTFKEHYTYSKVHFILPGDSKQIVKNSTSTFKDVVSGESVSIPSGSSVYFTDYGYGNPADSYERYNRKGFQILAVEGGKVVHLGRDMFYAGVKKGFFVGPFEKNMVKTIQKLNRRLNTGSRYL